MFRLLFIGIFLLQFLYAQDITFSEKKYIYAFDNEFKKIGKLSIDTQKVVLEYPKSQKKVIYTKDLIQIIDKDTIQNFTHKENIQYDLFFRLVIAIYNNDLQQLQENFLIKRDRDEVTLLPKEQIASVIEKISFEKIKERLKYLTISFQNQDRITIEQIN